MEITEEIRELVQEAMARRIDALDWMGPETKRAAREKLAAMKNKIKRLVHTDPTQVVDASGYTPPDALDADVKTGARQPRSGCRIR